jgi:hypothetical protein
MMGVLHNDVLDNGLFVLTDDANALHWCSAEPADYADALALSLGNRASPTVSAPGARAPSGRKVTVAAVMNGDGTGDGTITHWALLDTVGERLLAAAPVDVPKATNIGDTITSAAFELGIPGPA